MTSQCAGVSARPSCAASARTNSSDHWLRSIRYPSLSVWIRRSPTVSQRVGSNAWVVAVVMGRQVAASGRQRRAAARRIGTGGLGLAALAVAAAPDEFDEPGRPVVAPGRAQVRERREHVADDDAVALAVDAVAALHRVGEAHPWREILDRGMVEFVRAHDRLALARCGPRKRRGLLELHVAAPDRTLAHHDVRRNRADHRGNAATVRK